MSLRSGEARGREGRRESGIKVSDERTGKSAGARWRKRVTLKRVTEYF